MSQTTQSSSPAIPNVPPKGAFYSKTFAALQYPNYRLWFFGQMISLVGTWMQSTAQQQFMFELTKSPAYLGYVGFASGIPTWLFMLYGGLVADRMPRRNLLIITQTSMLVLAFVLAALTFMGLVQPWHILVLAFLLGIANAFDAPARLAFVPELVGREHLTNAIALNATMFNTASFFGPAVAGLTFAAVGPGWCFTLNGISFIAVIGALLLMKIAPSLTVNMKGNQAVFYNIIEGFRFVARERIVLVLTIGVGVMSLFGQGFATLFPAWAARVLGGDATTNGFLQSARGLGALAGALTLATLAERRIRGRLLTLGSFAFPLFLILFSFMRFIPLALVMLACVGFASIFFLNLANATVQTHTPDELRGRVMSVYSLSFFGLLPLGSLLAGNLATLTGEPITVLSSALIVLGFASLVFILAPQLRRVM